MGKTGIEPPGRPAHRRQNIKCILKIGWGVDRSGSGWGELVGICERGTEPSGSIKCEDFD